MNITSTNTTGSNGWLAALFHKAESKFPLQLRRDGWYLYAVTDAVC